jgi:hypothetical protein
MINPPSHTIGTDPHPYRGTLNGLLRLGFHLDPRDRIGKMNSTEVEGKLKKVV